MVIKSVLLKSGATNNNGCVYDKETINKAIEEYNNTPILGRIERKGTPLDLMDVSHTIENLKVNDNGDISGDIKFLNTPMGKVGQEMIKSLIMSEYHFEPFYNPSNKLVSIDLIKNK